MVHIDVKKVGQIPDRGGWRVHGRGSEQAKAAECTKRKTAKRGYAYLYSAVDGYSCLTYTEALPTRKPPPPSRSCTGPRLVRRTRHDPHRADRHRQRRVLTARSVRPVALSGSRHQRITPYTPSHNEKVERYDRITAEEFLYARTWTSED